MKAKSLICSMLAVSLLAPIHSLQAQGANDPLLTIKKGFWELYGSPKAGEQFDPSMVDAKVKDINGDGVNDLWLGLKSTCSEGICSGQVFSDANNGDYCFIGQTAGTWFDEIENRPRNYKCNANGETFTIMPNGDQLTEAEWQAARQRAAQAAEEPAAQAPAQEPAGSFDITVKSLRYTDNVIITSRFESVEITGISGNRGNCKVASMNPATDGKVVFPIKLKFGQYYPFVMYECGGNVIEVSIQSNRGNYISTFK